MIYKYRKLPRSVRWLILMLLLLFYSVLSLYNLAPGVVKGLFAGLLFGLLISELFDYIGRRRRESD